ncbi:acyl-CoA dehydrogenase [Cupriavidus gilardii J11]|uniref:Acyl-CoA dehydrogenase n=1 Tax=Cupriavidus gilardii J11 TaxID=936133 RepID=A0A562BJZ1_9BURK|nr:acyl-CoA dehydrogenase family protein [Cupriavidus gilardii]TWG85617.1 acyl-CoA dehydrogenase [Cupriavidus gilardii J11]
MKPSLKPLDHLTLPFFEARHRDAAGQIAAWTQTAFPSLSPPATSPDIDVHCRELVASLGEAGILAYCVPRQDSAGNASIDSRSLCLARELLAQASPLADFSFAMQGLGSGAISLAGSDPQKAAYLDDVAKGNRIAAFALSEPDAGSDVGGMRCEATRRGEGYMLNGEKMWISNGGIADFYVVFAREPGTTRSSGISAFIVDADNPGLEVAERIDVISPHPLARLRFRDCYVDAGKRLGNEGEGFKLAMRTLDIFRTSVAAAALGFARKALRLGIERALSREMFGGVLADMQLTQATIADMATAVESSALLVYRAAWMRDQGVPTPREAAMAKLVATESAQRVVDSAVQIWGGAGVRVGEEVEALYRDVRALRIYEGASEVQRLIIGGGLIKAHRA